jgi:hypothetical protein
MEHGCTVVARYRGVVTSIVLLTRKWSKARRN